MLINCAGMCVNELLWMLSWGWHQLVLGIIFSWLLYVFVGKMRMIPALVLVLGAYGFAVFVYFSFVVGVVINYFQWQFVEQGVPYVYGTVYASLLLGAIYTFLQSIFFAIISYCRPFAVFMFFAFSCVANSIAALLASCFIKITF